MKTIDLNQICPYTGLRSFTEEESLYFKGRDSQVDQITSLLEQNKFLMVTGASGEGKSSLIYAGLIPNARAGFFKAKYTNWVVADFRPERSPVKNMAGALAEKFGSTLETVETELRRGFSSLIDLYTNSEFYTDDTGIHWEQLPDAEKRDRKRRAANLVILVDQFEEFFTNPENFYNKAPSQDSQIVVNLILETARIAIKRNLPVYIVCTMRSDYIGQCSAFRGLPEYIGFSQFFVPRLKRKDLKQVIEEPAILSGNRIAQRLVERLVYDLSEGIDQLPILQHALSRVWLAADHGRQEMDLIHYAMAGGMPAGELPDEDLDKLQKWFDALPAHHQKHYKKTGLNKVIEIHASILYENAWEYFNTLHTGITISQQQTKRIIALTFSCLTKIDNSRAVRNRMTLGEIAEIINDPALTPEVIGGVINSYREEGNSFIRPFKTDDPSTHTLSPDTVLDITHESLIRNWNKLNSWANREFEFYSTYLDFRKQLDRWKESGRSSGFLLPVGPLAYFENWYNACKPNTGWIRRYSEIEEHKDGATVRAEAVLADIHDFLKRSARKVLITRAFMKYGAQRIAMATAVFILLILSGFYWYDADQKKNEKVIQTIKKQAVPLLASQEVTHDSKANYILVLERSSPGSLIPYLQGIELNSRISLSVFIYKRLLEFDKHYHGQLKEDLIALIVKSLDEYDPQNEPDFLLAERNKFLVYLAYDEYYNPNAQRKNTLTQQARLNQKLVLKFYHDPRLYKPTVPVELNLALQYWLTFGNAQPAGIDSVLAVLSPFNALGDSEAFTTYYPPGSFEPNGRGANNFNGGFHTLASLYAAKGEVENVIKCFEKMLETGQRSYFEVPRTFNNHVNIIGYFYLFGHRAFAPQIINWIGQHTAGNPPQTLLRNAVIRSGYITHLYIVNVYKQTRSHRGYFNVNLCLAPRETVDALFEDYEKVLRQIKDPSERNFWIAMNYKRRAIFLSKNHYDRNLPEPKEETDRLFAKAVDHFRLVDESHLKINQTITIPYYTDGVRTRTLSWKQLFIYPDYKDGWFARPYHTDAFFEYLVRNNLLTELYQSPEDFSTLHFWIAKAFEVFPENPKVYTNFYPLPDDILESVLSLVDATPGAKGFDKNLLYMVLANRNFEQGDTADAMRYFRLFNQDEVLNSLGPYEYIEKTFFRNQMKYLAANLALGGKHEEATALAQRFDKDDQRIYAYIFMADRLYRDNFNPRSFVYLDSVMSLAERINFTVSLDSRYEILGLLSRIGSEPLNALALDMLREMPQNIKTWAIQPMASGIASEGNYYRALALIPPTLMEDADLSVRMFILWEDCKKQDRHSGDNTWKPMDDMLDWFFNYTNFGR